MAGEFNTVLQWIAGVPAPLMYLMLGFAAALENVLPPIPADTVVLFGGFLAGRGTARVDLVFFAVWLCNVAGALLVYGVGRRHGKEFFTGRWGRMLLKPNQLASLDRFYRRYGFAVIFFSRFLPMFRAVVPIFAGVAGIGVWKTALPLAIASGIWYGALVYLGTIAGENWEQILGMVNRSGRWLGLLALIAAGAVAVWWRRSRREETV